VPALFVLAVTSAFFAWVSVEPFWLALGHARTGTATVTDSDGVVCHATFVADAGTFTASPVKVAGVDRCTVGTALPARTVSARATRAYATDATGLNLRWGVGLGLVLVCGLMTMAFSGATRLTGWRRGVSVGLSLAAPVAVTVAMLAVTY
jgi:hypothetical protein